MPFSRNTDLIYADGPTFAPHEPPKPDIRVVMKEIEAAIDAYSSGAGSIAKQTLAQLNADLAKVADTTAWVFADPLAANNGIYRKIGASGTGSWIRILPLPFSFIIASDAGAGTPNAIQATSSVPVSSSSLVWLQIAQTNTASPVVVSFNGGSGLTIKTNTGNDPAAGGLAAGMVVLGIVSGSTFRIFNDQVSTAIVAAAEAAQAAAEAAAASINIRNVATRPLLKALNTSVSTLAFLGEGARAGFFNWTLGDFASRVTSDTAEALYLKADAISSSAGAWVRNFQGGADLRWFGASSAASDNAAAYLAAASLGVQIYIPEGTFTAVVTAGNVDALRNMLSRCYGPGTIDLFLATGIYNTANFYGFTNAYPVNVTIRGENLSGSLTAASVTFAGTALNYTAAITFPALPAGIAVGQLLSLVPASLTDKRSSQCLLAGSNKITNIAGNVVTAAIPYHGTVTTKMPTIVGTVSFSGSWRLNKSVINYTGARTPIFIQSPLARVSITDIGLNGPYVSGNPLLSSGISVGWVDEDRHYVKDQLKLSGVGVCGFAYAILGQGAKPSLGDFRVSNCYSAVAGRRISEFYATSLYVGSCAGDAIDIIDLSQLSVSGDVMSCGNAGRGLWTFSGKVSIFGVASFGYNVGAGCYAKAGASLFVGVDSCAFRNNNIGWGNENASVHVDGTVSEYNLISGYEAGQGNTSAYNTISRYNENGYYALLGATIFADNCDSYGNTQNGGAAGELSTIRAKNGKFHDNTLSGLSLAGNSHIRADTVQLYGNGRYGVEASINSSARLPGVTGAGGTLGKYDYDPTSTGTTW